QLINISNAGSLAWRLLLPKAKHWVLPRDESSWQAWKRPSFRGATSMKQIVVTLVAAAGLMASVGCATKNNVRAQLTPVVNKVNELDDITAKNTNDIRGIDTRTQAGLNDVNAKSAAADQKAQAAGQKAGEAQQLAST